MYARDLKKLTYRHEEILLRLVTGQRPIDVANSMGMHPDSVSRIAGTERGMERIRELRCRLTEVMLQTKAITPLLALERIKGRLR